MSETSATVCPDENTLFRYVADRLEPEQVTELQAHIDTCPSCRQLLAEAVRGSEGDEKPGPAAPTGGTQLGRYVVLEVLGAGAMGVVYAAYDPHLDRRVALKLLHPGEDDPRTGEKLLLREAQAMARLSHPNVVAVHDSGTFNGQTFIAMEFVSGLTLRRWLTGKKPGQASVLAVMLQAGRGLAAAHAAGIVHRDFKPDNILVDEHEHAKVSDFGLARLADAVAENGAGPLPSGPRGERSLTGAVLGTPAYMAPEVRDGKTGDARSDQYSFCVTLHEALCGDRPHEGTVKATLAVPPRVRRALQRGLSADPSARFADMSELIAAVKGRPARRLRLLALLGVVGVALGVAAAVRRTAPVCASEQRRLDGVWDAEVRRAGRQAFAATGSAFAEGSWNGVERAIDTWSSAWLRAARDACEATRVRGEQTEAVMALRGRCLSRRLGELEALTRLLTHADSEVVAGAPGALRALGSLEQCADGEALAATSAPHSASKDVRELKDLEQQIASARTLKAAGKYPAALTAAKAAAEGARAATDLSLMSESLALLADVEVVNAAAESAAGHVDEALVHAETLGDPDLAAQAWIVTLTVQTARGKRDEAATAARHAAAYLSRIGPRPSARAALEYQLGRLKLDQGRNAEALEHLREAVRLSRSTSDIAQETTSLFAMGYALSQQGRHAEADATYATSAEAVERHFGPEHPNLILYVEARAIQASLMGHNEDAVKSFLRVLKLEEQVPSFAKLKRSITLNNLGEAYRRTGELALAEQTHRQAIALAIEDKGPIHRNVGIGWEELGMDLAAAGRHSEALDAFAHSLDIFEKTVGPEAPRLAPTLVGLGRAKLELKAPQDALKFFSRAVKVTTPQGSNPAEKGQALFGQARALWATGEKASAATQARAAVAELEKAGEEGRNELELAQQWLELNHLR